MIHVYSIVQDNKIYPWNIYVLVCAGSGAAPGPYASLGGILPHAAQVKWMLEELIDMGNENLS